MKIQYLGASLAMLALWVEAGRVSPGLLAEQVQGAAGSDSKTANIVAQGNGWVIKGKNWIGKLLS